MCICWSFDVVWRDLCLTSYRGFLSEVKGDSHFLFPS